MEVCPQSHTFSVVMDCEKQTSRNTFEIWPVVSSNMRIRFEHWSAHAKLGHNAVSSTAMFVAKTYLLNTCKPIDMKRVRACWRDRMAASDPCCLKQCPRTQHLRRCTLQEKTSLQSLRLSFTSTLGRIESIHLRLHVTIDMARHHVPTIMWTSERDSWQTPHISDFCRAHIFERLRPGPVGPR